MSKLSEEYGGPLADRPTIWGAFKNNVDQTPDALALICTHQPAGLFGIPNIALDHDTYHQQPYLRWSYRSVHDAVGRLAGSWHLNGIQEGSILVTFAPNGVEYALAAYAAISMGCKLMPINPRNLTNRDEVVHMVKTGLSISSGEKLVVMVGNEQLAKDVDELAILPAGALKIAVSERCPDSTWVTFESLMQQRAQANGNGQAYNTRSESDVDMSASPIGGTILFTSGTTSLPKGVFHPYQSDMARVMPYQKEAYNDHSLVPGSRFCCSLPNNHAMGWISLTWAFTAGAALVIPGPAFDPAAVLRALKYEKATQMIMVPTMVHVLVAAKTGSPEYAGHPLSDLESVMLGGSNLDPETLRLVTSELGAQGGLNFWGCTEGALTRSRWVSDPAGIADGHELSVGWPLPGYTLKIVDPEIGQVVPRNVLGEIEASGPGIVEPYIGGVGKDVWYRDEAGVLWYKTGDLGRIDEQGRVFVTGRYKDMIIRGGENISPTAIETVLNKHPMLSPLLPQVVGAKDPIAGEVPVAIVRGQVTPEIRETIQNEIIQHMGTLYVPEDVLSIQDLGLTEYPRTTSGKVQKTKLAVMANAYLSKAVEGGAESLSSEDLAGDVRAIWAKAVGLEPSHMRLDAPIVEFADSITVMRVRDRIKRKTGKVLSLEEMTATGTIQKQIEALRAMAAGPTKTQKARPRLPVRKDPLTAEDMAHLAEDPELFAPTKNAILEAISKFGLEWADVEDVMPMYDFNSLMSQTRLYDSWRLDFAIQPSSRVSKKQLRSAFEAVVCNNRILASFGVWDSEGLGSDDALHVVIKRSPKFFDLIVEDGGEVETLQELGTVATRHSIPEYIDYPGPLFHVLLFNVKEIDGAAMIISANHTILDASLGQIVQEDLDRTLAAANKGSNVTTSALLSELEPHVDYKAWADLHYNLRTSIEARAATKWHVKRLKLLAEHVKSGVLFPSAPRSEEAVVSRRGEEPVPVSVDIPGFQMLRKAYPHITASVVVKAAVALANVARTGHSHAAFGNLEAARTYFPFLPRAVVEQTASGHQFEATDVSGPTYQMVFNLVEANKDGRETVLQFLQRMQDEQTTLTKYASAPLREIMKGLDEVSPGSGALLPRLIDTQHFNWRPGLGTTGTDPFQHLKVLETVVRPTTGLVFHAGLGGGQSQTLFMLVYSDGPRVTRDEAADIGEAVVAITKWLTTEDNWALPVAQFRASFSDT